MLRHFLHSCYKIQARKEKDLTSKMGLNLAEYLRQKKRDGMNYKRKINLPMDDQVAFQLQKDKESPITNIFVTRKGCVDVLKCLGIAFPCNAILTFRARNIGK